MEQLIQQVASGLANGAIYACLALALVMIFVSTDHINFAQGELAMFSAYLVWQMIEWGFNFWIALPLVCCFSFLVGVTIERVVLRPLHSAPVLSIVVVFIVGSWSGSVAERHFGKSDPGHVVIDEVLGQLMTLFMNPVGWIGALVGFGLFRLMDIVKPYPANRFEALHGGVGIMADDAMAGVYANIALRLVLLAAHAGGWTL